jgi:hypothetical protein
MAPTNRLIEARRAELRAEASTRKPNGDKTAAGAGSKRPPKPQTKPKA